MTDNLCKSYDIFLNSRMTDVHQRTPNAPAYDIAAKILLIGEAGVGKTHLILRYGKWSVL